MNDVEIFEDQIIAVTSDGFRVLINGDSRLIELMDGSSFDDNAQSGTLEKFPTEPGIYRARIQFVFWQGYYEGWKVDGESDWDFIPLEWTSVQLIHVKD